MEVTLFKIDLQGANLTANAPFSGGDGDGDATELEAGDVSIESMGSGRGKGKLAGASVIGLLFLVAVGAVLRKLRGSDSEPEMAASEMEVEEVEEVEDVEVESTDDESGSGKGKLAGASVIGLLFLLVVALVARRVRGGGDDAAEPEAEELSA
jgi:hypothetical protein